jgi:hypothetical protein
MLLLCSRATAVENRRRGDRGHFIVSTRSLHVSDDVRPADGPRATRVHPQATDQPPQLSATCSPGRACAGRRDAEVNFRSPEIWSLSANFDQSSNEALTSRHAPRRVGRAPTHTTCVSVDTDTYQGNRAAQVSALVRLEEQLDLARGGGGARDMDHHHERGRLLARELVDRDTPFWVLSPLAGWGTDFTVGP